MRKSLLVAAFLLTAASISNAQIQGVEYASIHVDGKDYTFPIGNNERKNDVYYLKKALDGDKHAREIFMGESETKWFFIGENSPLWLKMTKFDEEVVVP